MNGNEQIELNKLNDSVGHLAGVVEAEGRITREQISKLFDQSNGNVVKITEIDKGGCELGGKLEKRVVTLEARVARIILIAVAIGAAVIGLDRLLEHIFK